MLFTPKCIIDTLKYLLSVLLLIVSLPTAAIDLSQTSEFRLQLQKIVLDLDFEGDARETDFLSIDLSIREQLTTRLDGAFWIGTILAEQSANPILAGQDTKGGYLGLDLRFSAIETKIYDLILSMDYRYSQTESSRSGQDIVWDWHTITLGMLNQVSITDSLKLNFGAYSRQIDGREKATGTLDQNTDFEGKDSVFGLISLQFELDRSGYMAIEVLGGSTVGGRIAFLRSF